ncbi:hypothetical protein [Bdellovibrio sp. KM01]|uniref:hypothetical protein n=1 Tax=Bdellovibrio sp. KM01 TaxID=2748865 RepID=UPI0015E98815|nr:hypothetical protein [Bdellovibrio sp. KM01]QLY24623.1 hypothetical protein HW988_14350 [Bdellovibrio sp. KM01]
MKSTFAVLILLVSLGARAESSDWKVGVGGGYSPNFLVNLKNQETPTSGTTAEKTYDMEYSGASGFSLHIWYAPKNSWGFISGLEYGAERELKKVTFNGMSTTNFSSSSASRYQQHNIYMGTEYRWDSFYLPFALIYSTVNFRPATTFLGSYEAKGGAGIMLGVGWFIGEHFVIEYVGRSSTTELNTTTSSGTTKGTGTIASAMLTLKLMY